MKIPAAFFDIDGTLYREALSVELFKKLSKNSIIPPGKWYNEIKPVYDNWVNREGDYGEYINILSQVYRESIIGLSKEVLSFFADQVIEEKGDRLYVYTKNKINWHKENGHKTIIISGAPQELVAALAAKLDVDDYVGTGYLVDEDGFYTGEIRPMWDAESKKTSVEMFIIKYKIDMSKSYAYGDTDGDFTMLKDVAYPTVINPTQRLLDLIRSSDDINSKTTIIVERKNVIYHLKKDGYETL